MTLEAQSLSRIDYDALDLVVWKFREHFVIAPRAMILFLRIVRNLIGSIHGMATMVTEKGALKSGTSKSQSFLTGLMSGTSRTVPRGLYKPGNVVGSFDTRTHR
jgi:hypothetical protein